ncbi:MAG: ABC transporter ATP-binding protein [Acidimicrobiia bacterium]
MSTAAPTSATRVNGPTVVLHGVEVHRSSGFTLDIAHLSITPGFTVLVGPNGAGKTTLIEMVATVTAPTTGSVTIGGSNMGADGPERVALRRGLGFLPQGDVVPHALRVGEAVDYAAVLREIGDDSARCLATHRALRAVGLHRRAAVRCRRLSGGERRRVALAMALLADPALLVLDEPLDQLDPEIRDDVIAELRRRADSGATVVASGHEPQLLGRSADRMLLVHSGRLAFDGSPAQWLSACGATDLDAAYRLLAARTP